MLNLNWSYEDASKELDKIIEENEYKKNKSILNKETITTTTTTKTSTINDKDNNEIICSICGHIGHHHGHNSLNNSSIHHEIKEKDDSFIRSLSNSNNNNNNHKKFSVDDSYLSTSHDSIFHNSHNINNNNRSYFRTPDSILVLESKHSSNNVIMAFRDLQNKAKAVEKERLSAIRVLEELRQELAESKRSIELARNKQELRANDHYLSLKSSTEELMVGHSKLKTKILSKTEELAKIQNQLLNQQAKQSLLESEQKKYKLEIINANEKLSNLRNDYIHSTQRIEKLENSFKLNHNDTISTLHNHLDSIIETIERDKIAITKADTRLIAMEKYLEIILKVNGDLCEAITSQADAQNRIARLTERQLFEESKLREKEVQLILENAETIGLNRALEVNRQVKQLIGPRLARSVSPPIKHSKNNNEREYYINHNHNHNHNHTNNMDIKRRSISPSRYDKSVIEAAARMAATAAATSLVAAQSSAHCSVCPIKKFIPTSSKTNKEFNVVATVSKASREARNLNAKVASRVKSLDYNGTGSLYQSVDRVDLQDMHKYLRAVKKLHTSS